MSTEIDPFTQVHRQLETLIWDSTQVRSRLKETNLIGFSDEGKNPQRQNIQHGNLPEVSIFSIGNNEANLWNTSNTSMIVKRYEIQVATGDMRITEELLPLEFAVTCALTNWKSQLGQLTWNDLAFVKRANIINSRDGIADKKLSRGIGGWSTIMTIEVEMHFKTLHMQEY